MSARHWYSWSAKSLGLAIAAAALCGQGARTARADFDVRPGAASGKVVTGGVDDGTGETPAVLRVFGYEFGEGDSGQPFFTQDPGFNALVGSGLQAGPLSFDVLGPTSGSALPFNLSYWDGTGAVAWTAAPAGETLQWNRGASNLFVSSGTSPLIAGFTIGTVAAAGNIHQHLNAFLNGADGNSLPAGPGDWGAGDGVEAAPGIYAISIVLKNGTLANSDPIWIFYNSGLDESAGDAAAAWLTAHAVPEPSAWLLGSAGGAILLFAGRRVRRRAVLTE